MAGPPLARGASPVQPTRFIGRRADLAEVRRMLTSSRLVTLAGPPGVGKTRLAFRAAEEVARRFRHGVSVVELEGLRDPSLIAQEVARALGLHDASIRWALETLTEHVRDKRLLLVLDNCEHLLDACALLVDSLLRSCPRLHMLTTSRRSLGVDGESVMRVPPLSVPQTGSGDGEALELLMDRARMLGSADLDRYQREVAAELCRRLDGIPLAIELAAVRLRTLSIEQVLERLGDRFRLLGEARTAPPHRRTLRAALDWSYALVSDDEGALWQTLSVFPGSFELAAVEAVCEPDIVPEDQLLDMLDGLVDQSVITAVRSGNEMRYRMLESVRDYGLEKLRAREVEAAVRSRHRDHFATLCQEAWSHWTDAEQPRWFERLDREHHNLRTALDWCIANGDPEIGCSMASNLWLYWEARGHLTEGRRRVAALLDLHQARDRVRAKALWVAGYLALGQTDAAAAEPLLRDGLDLARVIGDEESAAFATQYLGLCRLFTGDLEGAGALFAEAFERQRQLGQGAAAFTLSDLATTRMFQGDLRGAIDLYERALPMIEAGGDPWTKGHCLWGLGMAAWLSGDVSRAERSERASLRLSGELDERTGIALSLSALAWIAAARGDFGRGALLHGAAQSVWGSIPRRLPEPLQGHASRFEETSRRAIGDDRYRTLVGEGRRLERAAAVAAGVEDESANHTSASVQEKTDAPLTRREVEVADLVARGMTDREIARELVISQRTAESHVQHILTKLGFRSRSQIAAWVAAGP